jgi:acetoin utilization deacetylase AcuC-like enzyme
VLISAGFDAHRKDAINMGYLGLVEEDYEWVTRHLVRIANSTCNGRVVSVLEGGYKIQGGLVSAFARSVAAHVRTWMDSLLTISERERAGAAARLARLALLGSARSLIGS